MGNKYSVPTHVFLSRNKSVRQNSYKYFCPQSDYTLVNRHRCLRCCNFSNNESEYSLEISSYPPSVPLQCRGYISGSWNRLLQCLCCPLLIHSVPVLTLWWMFTHTVSLSQCLLHVLTSSRPLVLLSSVAADGWSNPKRRHGHQDRKPEPVRSSLYQPTGGSGDQK